MGAESQWRQMETLMKRTSEVVFIVEGIRRVGVLL